MKIKMLWLVPAAFLVSACDPSANMSGGNSGGVVVKNSINGKSSVTFSGSKNRSIRYGTDSGTNTYCTTYKSGETQVSMSENGENRNNSGWAKDGLFFSLGSQDRPQDVKSITGYPHTVYAVLKEYTTDKGGTFHLGKPCTFDVVRYGNKLDGRFKCEDMQHSSLPDRVTAYGWFECELVEQNY